MVFCNVLLVFLISLQLGSYQMMIDSSLGAYTGHIQVQHRGYLEDQRMRQSVPGAAVLAQRARALLGTERVAARAQAFALASSVERSFGILLSGVQPRFEPGVSTLPGLVSEGCYLRGSGAAEIVIGDVLLAEHFDQFIIGVGGLANLGDAVLRGDVTFTDARDGWETSLVASWSYSWVWGGRNVSAVSEYFFNGFGLNDSDYSPEEIQADRDLTDRLIRGELFTLGRHYLAGSLLVEMTPLLNLTPNVFVNLEDGSALLQVVLQWDVAQNWQVLGSINAPVGASGTEYGGLETGLDNLTLEVGPSVFTQLAWYF